MKTKKTFMTLLLGGFMASAHLAYGQHKEITVDDAGAIKTVELKGYVGTRIDDCIAHRVKTEDIDQLIEPFKYQNELSRWQSEFWGKWILGTISSYRYTHDPELYQKIKYAVDGLLATQLESGYIGNYAPEAQLTNWDIWGRKYTLLGLLAYYDISGDKKALKAGVKLMDHLMTQVGPDKTDIVKTGFYRGMPSSSILEPLIYLYRRTQEKKYLDFAKYIVAQWESTDGPKLISKAQNGENVWERFPYPTVWWSWENGHKAYEMMSCYEGLLELYKETGDASYLDAVEKTVANIIDQEINVAGSGSAFECWYGGRAKQTQPTFHTMETCVTFTWMKLCATLLELTGKSCYADQIEKTTYNALMASLKGDASQIAKYSPLEGCRHAGEQQCGMHINCCNANGPRAFALLPKVAYQAQNNRININLYLPGQATIELPHKKSVQLVQTTDYPATGEVQIAVMPAKPAAFDVALRIPAWSEVTRVEVNGEEQQGIRQGDYFVLSRSWNSDDKIVLTLDMRARLMELNRMQAIVRGPILLARDSRFSDGYIDETVVIPSENGIVNLTPANDKSFDFTWLEFTLPVTLGTDLEGETAHRTIRFCDFGSAGNSWDIHQRYRVWLPKTINVMTTPYTKY